MKRISELMQIPKYSRSPMQAKNIAEREWDKINNIIEGTDIIEEQEVIELKQNATKKTQRRNKKENSEISEGFE